MSRSKLDAYLASQFEQVRDRKEIEDVALLKRHDWIQVLATPHATFWSPKEGSKLQQRCDLAAHGIRQQKETMPTSTPHLTIEYKGPFTCLVFPVGDKPKKTAKPVAKMDDATKWVAEQVALANSYVVNGEIPWVILNYAGVTVKTWEPKPAASFIPPDVDMEDEDEDHETADEDEDED